MARACVSGTVCDICGTKTWTPRIVQKPCETKQIPPLGAGKKHGFTWFPETHVNPWQN